MEESLQTQWMLRKMVYQRTNRYFENWYGRIIENTKHVKNSEEDNSEVEKGTREEQLPDL